MQKSNKLLSSEVIDCNENMKQIVKCTKSVRKNKVMPVRVLKNGLVFQHNHLIEANYRLSLQEKRIILWLTSQIQPNDIDFKKHTISAADFCDLTGVEVDYSYLHNVIKKLMSKTITIKKLEENSITTLHWISYAKYLINSGMLELNFHPELKPFLIAIKDKFTVIRLSDMMQFSSVYAIRIYELLKQYEGLKKRVIDIQDLRLCCGVEDKLKQYKEFRERVLEIAQREINNKSDIHIEYEPIKKIRKYTSIQFTITKNKEYYTNTKLEVVRSVPDYALLAELMDFGIKEKAAKKLIYINSTDVIKIAIQCVDIQIQKGKVRNARALLLDAIKHQYNPFKYQPKVV